MARTYNTTHLALNDPTSADWALAYVRFALRDKPNDADAYPANSLDDAEINAALEAGKITDATDAGGDGTVYYPAHKVAARIVHGDPERLRYYNLANVGAGQRSADEVANAIRKSGRWIDDAIIAATDGRIGGSSLVLRL